MAVLVFLNGESPEYVKLWLSLLHWAMTVELWLMKQFLHG